MSSCISGGRAYGFDIEMIKSTSSSSITSNSSSILSESSKSPTAISTRKPRTPRKRPNQTYNEAAAILSTAYPKIFSAKHLTKPPSKFPKLNLKNTIFDPAHTELLLPFPLIDNNFSPILLNQPILEKPNSRIEQKPLISPSTNSSEKGFQENCCDDDFDTESMLDEEIEEGIDSIMGNLSVDNRNESVNEARTRRQIENFYGYPMGLGLGFNANFDFGFGMRRRTEKCLRKVEEGDWWRFPCVETPILKKIPEHKKKKKVEKVLPAVDEVENPSRETVSVVSNKLMLKLNYDDVLEAWSGRGASIFDEVSGSESSGNDLHARLSQVELFTEGGGEREASMMRYREKKRTRLFSKKIRYQVRKVNADQRPRMKGRFVRRPNCNFAISRQ